jgi:Abnormal spindle-like microcephaly-assoc'd, ASPM-SPD-2-Hydin
MNDSGDTSKDVAGIAQSADHLNCGPGAAVEARFAILKAAGAVLLVAFLLTNSGCTGLLGSSGQTGTNASASNAANGSNVNGSDAVTVRLAPSTTGITTNASVQLTASVSSTSNTDVTWSIVSGGGTVTANGLYIAPGTAGTATVKATSMADVRASALAVITVSEPVDAVLSGSPSSIPFGSVTVGSSATSAITLRNTGNVAITVFSATTAGSDFAISGSMFPFTLAAGASQTVNVMFAPSGSGAVTGSAAFVSNATNSPATIALAGSGTAPVPHSVALAWETGGSTVNGYNVYRAATSGGPYAKLNGVVDPYNNFVDPGVLSGRTYYYVVTVVDATGAESGYSNQVAALIPTP